eukprot:1156520-Pelagomonas_calceolata.AAC.3
MIAHSQCVCIHAYAPTHLPLPSRLRVHMQASLESDRVRILAEIAADIGHTQLSLGIKEALVASAEHEAQQALSLDASTSAAHDDATALRAAKACNKATNVMLAAGKYNMAEKYSSKQYALYGRLLGPEHPDTLESKHFIALSLNFQGKHAEAEGKLRQVIELQQKVLGPEHFLTIRSMSNLAVTMGEQGRHAEAEGVQRQEKYTSVSPHDVQISREGKGYIAVLELMQKTLGYEHPDTLACMVGLAASLGRQGKLTEAEAMEQQV